MMIGGVAGDDVRLFLFFIQIHARRVAAGTPADSVIA